MVLTTTPSTPRRTNNPPGYNIFGSVSGSLPDCLARGLGVAPLWCDTSTTGAGCSHALICRAAISIIPTPTSSPGVVERPIAVHIIPNVTRTTTAGEGEVIEETRADDDCDDDDIDIDRGPSPGRPFRTSTSAPATARQTPSMGCDGDDGARIGGGGADARRRRWRRGAGGSASSSMGQDRDREALLAKHLAWEVSSLTTLRNVIDGITVGSCPRCCIIDCRLDLRRVLRPGCATRGKGGGRRVAARRGWWGGTKGQWTTATRRWRNAANDKGDDNVSLGRGGERSLSLDRLRDVSPERSPLAIVAMQPEDLERPNDRHRRHLHRDRLYLLPDEGIQRYYVGSTSNRRQRYDKHASRRGSKWTRMHAPIPVHEE